MMDAISRTLAVSASALRAERMRLDAIASNLANANTTRTAEGGPYRRRSVVLAAEPLESPFGETLLALGDAEALRGVAVQEVTEDTSAPRMVFDPAHPDANPEGYVAFPNISPVLELVDLMAATRAYEANAQAVQATRAMTQATLAILG